MNRLVLTRYAKKLFVYIALYTLTVGIIFSTFFFAPRSGQEFHILRAVIVFFCTVLLTKYFVYMILSPWHDVFAIYRDIKYRNKLAHVTPRVSVLIPARNESVGILRTIDSLLKSTYRNAEIVIVNDGSTDDSDARIRSFIHRYENGKTEYANDIALVYRYQPSGGKGNALNHAFACSEGDIIVSIDADCIVFPDTLSHFVRCFSNPEVMAAVGNVKIGNTNTIIGVIQYLEFLFSFYFKKAESVLGTIYIIGGAAGAFRRSVFQKIGTYSTTNITEDIELSVRIQNAGMKVVYADKALVYTEGASEMKGLLKQRLRWKRGRFETFLTHKNLFFSLDKKHNKILSWVILPLAYFGELQLSLEPFFLVFLYVYSFFIHDFSSFISGIIVVASMFFVQLFFDNGEKKALSFYLLAPIGWLLFYVSTFVEFNALLHSILGLARKQEIKWQEWQRTGIDR